MSNNSYDADVIVAGAGPSGLTVACEAALGGARVIVLEKRDGPTWSRAGTLAPRVMELFEMRGIADRFSRRALELHSDPYSREYIWGGLSPVHCAAMDTDYRYVLMFAQLETEKLLAERFLELGGDLRLRHEVTGLEQDDEGVTVVFRNSDGVTQSLRARYLVGADGNKSPVRQAAGIAFKGTPASRVAVNVDAFTNHKPAQVLTVKSTASGWAMTYPLRNGLMRFAMIDAATCHDISGTDFGLDEAKAMLRRVHGTDYDITQVDAINRFHDAMFLAERLRDRRVFLVGESVRIHYPASGVGMNFCIQDAFNLGWKLAADVTGRAPAGLLDSFETERMPEIKKLLNDVRRQLAIQFNFDEEHMALKHFVENNVLANPDLNLEICENLAGLSVKYPSTPGSHPLVGRRLPNLSLIQGKAGATRVFDLLQGQGFALLDLKSHPHVPESGLGARLTVASADPDERAELCEVASVLVRPDGYVAWASDTDLNSTTAEQAIREWLNVPTGHPVFRTQVAAN